MGLLDAIPGLAAHQEQTVPQLSDDEAGRLISDAVSLISSVYPTGALEWVSEKRSDVMRHLAEAEQEVDAAAIARDRARLVKALDGWTKRYKRAFALFEDRPKVLQRQEG